MIELGVGGGRPARSGRHPRRELTAEAPRSLSTDSAAMWLEDDDGKIVIGANADTDLYRAAPGRLATSGAFQIGEGDDLCSAAEDAGSLRYNAAKQRLQVCDGSEWKTAGGAKLEANDDACTPDIAGVTRFQEGAFSFCDGSEWFVVLGQPTVMPTKSPTQIPGKTADNPLASCKALPNGTPSGLYYIGSLGSTFLGYCNMDTARQDSAEHFCAMYTTLHCTAVVWISH